MRSHRGHGEEQGKKDNAESRRALRFAEKRNREKEEARDRNQR
jgi:hypothetical protein